MNKKYYYLVVFLFSISSIVYAHEGTVFIVSIPKCGTHLLIKLIEILTGMPSYNYTERCQKYSGVTDKNYLDSNNNSDGFLWDHIPYSERLLNDFKQQNVKVLFIYRDPRDQVVSWLYHIYRSAWTYYDPLRKLNYSCALSKFLQEDVWSWRSLGLKEMYQSFMEWTNDPFVYSIKFEDLVGTAGGGTLESQHNQIYAIAHFLGIMLTQQQVFALSSKLFGSESINFRKGHIGSWKDEFSSQDKDVFKAIAGDLLIELGYEVNLDW